MKKTALVIVICFILTFTGCASEYKYSERQSNVGAEYMAGVLLKCDQSNQKGIRLVAVDKLKKSTGTISVAQENEKKPTQTPTTEKTADEKKVVVSKLSTDSYTLTQVMDKPDFEFAYEGYEVCDAYPKSTENTCFSVFPNDKNQLLVVSVKAKNGSDHNKALNLYQSGVAYQLTMDGKTIYYPLNTLLENDMQYMNVPVKAHKAKKVLLVFEIPKRVDLSQMRLSAADGDRSVVIVLK
jgi:hypothetical protein